jgi:energy-coupling factor transport system ATP-binding protein
MIEFKNVSFFYGEKERENGIENINLNIQKGEVILLCGESGCGKTTLTRLINGLIPNYYEGVLTGDVIIDGTKVSTLALHEAAKLAGSVFQNPRSQFFNVDTTSELVFGCENMGLKEEEISNRLDRIVNDFHLQLLMKRNIFHLSGGEKQKIACASVAMAHPEVFVLDEPSSNLDMCATQDLKYMIAYWKDQGKTIVVAEHRLYYLADLADRIVYMREGKIEKIFTQAELKSIDNAVLAKLGLRTLNLSSVQKDSKINNNKTQEIILKDFYFSYRHALILQIDLLDFPKGGIIALIGHNGAGKSTFARCLCGLEKKCKGKMCVCNQEYKNKDRIKQCYMVMQDVNHQLFTESVLDEILLSMQEQDALKAEEILHRLDLAHLKDVHPMALSGGQKQRVAIASAVASQREIIIFDEPTSGLDLQHMHEVARCIRMLNEMGKTILIISHDLEFILQSCTHVVCINQGSVIDNYSLDEKGIRQLKKFFTDIDI